jgi:hypothetical protein
MLYLCGCRPCIVTVEVTDGRSSRVCSDVGGGVHGQIVQELGTRIAGGSGCSGWLGIRLVCGCSGGGLQTVVGTVVSGWLVGGMVCGR